MVYGVCTHIPLLKIFSIYFSFIFYLFSCLRMVFVYSIEINKIYYLYLRNPAYFIILLNQYQGMYGLSTALEKPIL